MNPEPHAPDALERLFHEPSRLAIMSALAAAERAGLTFTELKEQCRLTDGNLNRHLAALEDSEIEEPVYTSRWGQGYTIEQMLEHAVVHPMRHRVQLERLMREAGL